MNCPEVIDVFAPVGPAVAEVLVPGPPGTSGESTTAGAIRQAVHGNTFYIGKAPAGTAGNASLWKITRGTINPSGGVVIAVAQNIAWNNYLTGVYS